MTKHVHFIGIGGTGLSAIAQILLESGYKVTGSDRQASMLTERVQAAGAQVFIGHRAENVTGADIVVRSWAVPDDNIEVQSAKSAGIPVLRRSEFLGELTKGRRVIAIAGTHGKTTTTAMISWLLSALGLDPSFIVGGVLSNLGTNAHLGGGDVFVIEADEYDRMFLGLSPYLAVVTNVEHDHPDCYPTYQEFFDAFLKFSERIEHQGALLTCREDVGANALGSFAKRSHLRVLTYGWQDSVQSESTDYIASNIAILSDGNFSFDAYLGNRYLCSANLQVPGRHNVLNALATIGVAHVLNLDLESAARLLGNFRGVGRRFELRGEVGGVVVIDDYAHHPTEIRATLAAARSRFPKRSLWVVWQPHTYSRTRRFFEEFSHAFQDADHVLVTEVYPAREPIPADFSAYRIVQAMKHPDAHFMPDLIQVVAFLLERLQPGDVLLVLSAGDADKISTQILAALGSGNGH